MPEITFDQAKEFLENITSEDKVAIIHHDDGDGFCSGILFYDWCKNKNAEVDEFTYNIGKSSLDKFDLKKFNKLIVCDLAPDFMAEEFEQLTDKKIFYTDHHKKSTPLPKEIIAYQTDEQGYFPSARTAGELTGLKHWLSVAGTVTDAADLYPENNEFIDNFLKKNNMTLEQFKENITSKLTNFLVYFKTDPKKAFEILEGINSLKDMEKLKEYSEEVEAEINQTIERYETEKEKLGDINFFYFEPNFSVTKPVSGIISRKNDDEAFIFAALDKGKEKIKFSARSQDRSRDMSALLKAGVKDLKEGNAGGHLAAAGAQINKEDLEKFKENIRDYIQGK